MKIELIHDTETRIHLPGRTLILLGTAHISQESVTEVSNRIVEEHPSSVCVEIDSARYQTLTEGQNWENMNITQILKQKKGFLLIANLILSSFQKRMGVDVGVKPGQEMMAAIQVANDNGIPVVLADRDIHITLRRAWALSSFWGKAKLLSALIASVFTKEELAPDDIEKLKERSALDNMMNELSDYLPAVKTVLIDERDQFLAHSIFHAAGDKTLAIVGAGHVPGILKNIEALDADADAIPTETINTVPKTSLFKKICNVLIPVAVIAAICGISFAVKGFDGLKITSIGWLAGNAVFSGLGALLALGNPLSVLIAAVAAPITSLGIPISSGVIAGIAESLIRKPKVTDFTNLSSDILSVKGIYRNRVTRSLLVFFLASVGSLIGTYLGFPLFSWLFSGLGHSGSHPLAVFGAILK